MTLRLLFLSLPRGSVQSCLFPLLSLPSRSRSDSSSRARAEAEGDTMDTRRQVGYNLQFGMFILNEIREFRFSVFEARLPNVLDVTVDSDVPTLPFEIPVHSNIKPHHFLKMLQVSFWVNLSQQTNFVTYFPFKEHGYSAASGGAGYDGATLHIPGDGGHGGGQGHGGGGGGGGPYDRKGRQLSRAYICKSKG